MKLSGGRRRRVTIRYFLTAFCIFTGIGLLLLSTRSVDVRSTGARDWGQEITDTEVNYVNLTSVLSPDFNVSSPDGNSLSTNSSTGTTSCANVEEMGEVFKGGFEMESLRVRKLIQEHFRIHGASAVRNLPPEEFCKRGFMIGKAFQAGFGNEMYKILTAGALSIMLNRSLIIGQTRHIGYLSSRTLHVCFSSNFSNVVNIAIMWPIRGCRGKYPFGDYISYTNQSFSLAEVKHLWRKNGCSRRNGRNLLVRIDDFLKPDKSGVLCSNWIKWEQPIIWFDGATDAVAAQFFLKSVHSEMRNAASKLFGFPENLESRPNVFGELMRVLITPSKEVEEAVNWVLKDRGEPDISLHMRMLMNRSVRAVRAALDCLRKALTNLQGVSRPRVVVVSETPSLIKDITPLINEFAEVLHFKYDLFRGNISGGANGLHNIEFRAKDWGPAPRWVAFVDFFLASQAKHAVVTGAHKRVGTTYAQLIAALAAANAMGQEGSSNSSFTFLSSFQHNLLSDGLSNQIGWGHAWNRFAGPLSCRHQSNQCAFTPLLPPAWWDGIWQSPISRDIRRMEAYGVQLSGFGTFDEHKLQAYCNSKREHVTTVQVSQM